MHSNSPESKPQPRNPVINGLTRRFIQELHEAMQGAPPVFALEIVNHLLVVVDQLAEYAQNEDSGVYETFWKGEETLTAKWGRLIKPYRGQKFEAYFDKINVLLEKGVFSLEEYNSQPFRRRTMRIREGAERSSG